MMNIHPAFWLFGLTALFAVPVAQQHCSGQATAQVQTASAQTIRPIQVSSHPTGITITGVN